MTTSNTTKAGWRWTKQGWKRTSKLSRHVKKAAKRRRPRAIRYMDAARPAERPNPRTVKTEADKAARIKTLNEFQQEEADSGVFLEREELYQLPATTLAGEAAKRIGGQQRKAWLGKYDDLGSKDEK